MYGINGAPRPMLTNPQRVCQSQANGEIGEVLAGLKERCEAIGVPYPEIVVADNCCHIRSEVVRHLPSADVVLDVYHLMMRLVCSQIIVSEAHFVYRYLVCVAGGMKNHYRKEVANDVVDAILKTRGKPATYWPQDEQARRLQSVFEKWTEKGIWSAAASKVCLLHNAPLLNHL
jgi:hypothetical protein